MPLPNNIRQSIEDICYSIKRGVVIPIVGYDMLFDEFQSDDREHDFLKLLIKRHAEKNPLEIMQTVFERANELTGYELVNSYYHNLPKKDNFKLQLSKTITDERYHLQLTSESIRKLVSIQNFNFFINGTFTNSLELAFNAYRAVGETEKQLKSSYNVLSYRPIQPDSLEKPAPAKFRIELDKPLIYNLFGTHDEAHGDYLLTDADYIELIYDLFLDKSEKFTNLLSYLNKANLLFLGCNFPDWFFRFFIRVCVGDRLDSASAMEKKTVIDSLNALDSSRSVFINRYKIQKLDIDCNTLVDEIYKFFKNEASGLLPDNGNNTVFISYCRKDEQVAKDIAAQFDEKYIEYFLDNNDLNTGDNLNDHISDAIDRCCLFLPIVSNNVQQASPYIYKEWIYASGKENLVIWPVFKDMVDENMLQSNLKANFSLVRERILNANNTIGVVLTADENGDVWEKRGNKIADAKLRSIKQRQIASRLSGVKRS